MKSIILALSISMALCFPAISQTETHSPGMPSATVPESQINTVLQDASLLQAESRELRAEVMSTLNNSGPSAMSTSGDDFMSRLLRLMDSSDNLLAEVEALISNVNVDVTRVSTQLISLMKGIQGDINVVATTLSGSVENIGNEIAKIIPNLNLEIDSIIVAIEEMINRVSAEIESAIREFKEAGIEQITILNDNVGTLILKVADSTEAIATTVDELGIDVHGFFETMKEASITQINLIGEEIVQVVQSINNGVQSVSTTITEQIDGIGNAIVRLIDEVTILIHDVGARVDAVGLSVNQLYDDTVDYIEQIEVDVTPRIYYTSGTGIDAGADVVLRNIVEDDDRHIVEFGIDDVDRSQNIRYSILYGYRADDLLTLKGGLLKGRAGAGVYVGNLYKSGIRDDFVWEAGIEGYGLGRDLSVDFVSQFGQDDGVRVFFELMDVNRKVFDNYRVGVGVGWTF